MVIHAIHAAVLIVQNLSMVLGHGPIAMEVDAMRLSDVHRIPQLIPLPVFPSNHPDATAFLDAQRCLETAEAVDTRRLFDLLHRHDYQPVAIIQFGNHSDCDARVYFQRVPPPCGWPDGSMALGKTSEAAARPRFLIADRDPAIREECRRFLAAHGHEVDVAADGLQCIERLRQMAPTLLALDPELLWGGGAGVLEWLREEAPFTPLTVLLIDGQGSAGIPKRVKDRVAGCLERPRNLMELAKFVNRLEHEASRRRSALSTTVLQPAG